MQPLAPQNTQAMGDVLAIFGGNIQTNALADSQFEVLPPCKPPAIIESAEFKDNKRGNGHYLEVVLQIVDGPHKGRKLWDRINVNNPSQECVRIGMAHLKTLLKAAGIDEFADSSQLINQIVIPHVAVDKNETFGEQNVIKKYSAPTEAQPQTNDAGLPTVARVTLSTPLPTAQPAAVAAPQAAGSAVPAPPVEPAAQGGKPPWER